MVFYIDFVNWRKAISCILWFSHRLFILIYNTPLKILQTCSPFSTHNINLHCLVYSLERCASVEWGHIYHHFLMWHHLISSIKHSNEWRFQFEERDLALVPGALAVTSPLVDVTCRELNMHEISCRLPRINLNHASHVKFFTILLSLIDQCN